MRAVTPEMAALIASNVTTLCRLWTIERKGGPVYRFTDHDVSLTFEGELYEANNSFMASAVQSRVNSTASDLDVTVLLAPGFIEYFDLAMGMFDGAPVTLKLVSWANLDAGSIALFDGKVSTVALPNQQVGSMSLLAGLRQLTTAFTERYSASCRAIFGDDRCKFDLATVTVPFVVDAVGGGQQFTASEITASPVNRFLLGTVRWDTGNNAGVRVEVAGNNTGTVNLMFKSPHPIEVGDTGVIIQGCAYTVAACNAYANLANYRGEPYVPGDDGLGV